MFSIVPQRSRSAAPALAFFYQACHIYVILPLCANLPMLCTGYSQMAGEADFQRGSVARTGAPPEVSSRIIQHRVQNQTYELSATQRDNFDISLFSYIHLYFSMCLYGSLCLSKSFSVLLGPRNRRGSTHAGCALRPQSISVPPSSPYHAHAHVC
jgi:hypothetical protein